MKVVLLHLNDFKYIIIIHIIVGSRSGICIGINVI